MLEDRSRGVRLPCREVGKHSLRGPARGVFGELVLAGWEVVIDRAPGGAAVGEHLGEGGRVGTVRSY